LLGREASLSAKPHKSADPLSDAAAAASQSKGAKRDKGQRGQSTTPSSSGKTETGNVNKNKTEASTSKDQKDKNKTGVAAKAKGEAKPSVKAAMEIPCFFFHNSTCLKGDACTFSHKAISDQKKQELVRPTKKDRSKTPDKGSKSDASAGTRLYCFHFYKSGTCHRDQCSWAHMTPEEVKTKGLQEPPTDKKKDEATFVATPCVVVSDDDISEW